MGRFQSRSFNSYRIFSFTWPRIKLSAAVRGNKRNKTIGEPHNLEHRRARKSAVVRKLRRQNVLMRTGQRQGSQCFLDEVAPYDLHGGEHGLPTDRGLLRAGGWC